MGFASLNPSYFSPRWQFAIRLSVQLLAIELDLHHTTITVMFDRALVIVGIALALVFGVWSLAPEGWPKLPPVVIYACIGLGILLIGCAVGLIFGERRKPDRDVNPKIIETNLFLQFSDCNSVPVEKNPRNIRHWFASFSESIFVDTKDSEGHSLGGFSVPPRWVVFLIFEKRPLYRQMIAVCKGPNSPQAIVQVSNAEYAVVSINGDVTSATLEISLIR
jgi:hypothetical protein